jgi:Ala-tRNA(Pro) deacylase
MSSGMSAGAVADAADIFTRIQALLQGEGVRFRIIEHVAEGRSEQIAAIRGNRPEQAAKAMVLQLKGGSGPRHVLAILSGNRKVDFAAVAAAMGARKASFAAAPDAEVLTGCIMGAVPPFSFDAALPVVVDPELLDNASLYFNAGRLDRSMELATADWLRIARPVVHPIAAPREV